MRRIPILAALALLTLPGLARASLIGTEVTVTNQFDGTVYDGPATVTVQAGPVELTNFGGLWDIDLESESILLQGAANPTFPDGLFSNAVDAYEFTGLDWGVPPGEIVGVEVLASGLPDGVAVAAGFTPNSVTLTFTSGDENPNGFTRDSRVQVNLQVRHIPGPDNPQHMPEPASLVLWSAAGALVFGAYRRRRVPRTSGGHG
jgi:hypothetical protein